jgi:hypothetical protein
MALVTALGNPDWVPLTPILVNVLAVAGAHWRWVPGWCDGASAHGLPWPSDSSGAPSSTSGSTSATRWPASSLLFWGDLCSSGGLGLELGLPQLLSTLGIGRQRHYPTVCLMGKAPRQRFVDCLRRPQPAPGHRRQNGHVVSKPISKFGGRISYRSLVKV